MREELYDIKVDIGEAHDLASVASHATTVRELRVRPIPVAHDSSQYSEALSLLVHAGRAG